MEVFGNALRLIFFVGIFLALVPEMEHVFFTKIIPMTLIASLL